MEEKKRKNADKETLNASLNVALMHQDNYH